MKGKDKKSKPELKDSLPVRYRPKIFDDVVGSEIEVISLRNMMKNRKMKKTWLFAGPSGSGKTTLARILARATNCQSLREDGNPCLECISCKESLTSYHPDILELNAGDARGIDDIRDLIKVANLAPRYNYRIIIIDEFQEATAQAKQILLKPLEQPPPNTIWMVCTTNPEKFTTAFIGRFQKVLLGYPENDELTDHLYKIAKLEYPKELRLKLKNYYSRIVDACGNQPRESVQALESLANAISDISDKKKIKETVDRIIKTVGEIDSFVMQFLAFCYKAKIATPLRMIDRLPQARFNDFLYTSHRYSYYAALYLISKSTKTRLDDYTFYGVNKPTWKEKLDELEVQESVIPLGICNAITKATEKARTGVLSPEQVMVGLVYESMKIAQEIISNFKQNIEIT